MQKQLHVVVNANPASGGEGFAALSYAQAVARAGASVTLASKMITQSDRLSGSGSFEQIIIPGGANPLFEFISQYAFVHSLCKQRQFDLIHLHGVWSPLLAAAAMVARMRRMPVIISPHGCLEPWALRYKRLKKWVALKTYQGMVLRSASMFVATADQELANLRRLGIDQPVAVIPIGVEVGPAGSRNATHPDKTILFLSRLHPVKGLLDLVEAWAVARRPGWRIVIAGGGEDDYRAEVEALIHAKGLDLDFEFVGPAYGDKKQACFERADIFILPTYSENFGIAIAEALANELPVITTTGAPWSDLVTHRCGWWVRPGVQGISEALNEAMKCDLGELKMMGRRGRELILQKYSWDKIGRAALEASAWIQDQSRVRPATVRLSDE